MADNSSRGISVGGAPVTAANPVPVQAVAGTAAIGKLAANSGVDIGDVDVLTVNGVAPQFDDTDKLAVSLYGEDGAAGNTPVEVTSGGVVSVSLGSTAALADGSNLAVARVLMHGTGSSLHLGVAPFTYNDDDAKWYYARGNSEVALLASAARTATIASADQTNYNARGVLLFLSITAVPGGDTVRIDVLGKDPISGTYKNLLVGTPQAATGVYTAIVYPGAVDTDSQITDETALPLPRTWRAAVTHSAGTSFTYSLSAVYIV